MTFPTIKPVLRGNFKIICFVVLSVYTIFANVHTPSLALNDTLYNQYQNNAEYAEKQHNYQEAIKWINKMIALNPTDAGNYHWRGVIKAEAKDYHGAITDLTKAITLKKKQGLPPNIHSYTARAGAYNDLKNTTLALNDLTYALTLDHEDATAYSNRGSIRWSLGDLSGALADYKKADNLTPNNPIVLANTGATLNAIAVSKANRQDFSGACDYFNQAVLYLNQAKEIAIERGDTPTYQGIMGLLKTIGSSRTNAGCY